MSRLVLLLLVAVISIVALTRDASPDPDTAVRVVTDDPIRVVLPVSPTETFIRARLAEALAEAGAEARDATYGAVLTALSKDRSQLDAAARYAANAFASQEAAALAYPIYRVITTEGAVTIAAATAELIPQLPGIAISRDHEDGHATVNDRIALRCGPRLVERAIAAGDRGSALEHRVGAELLAIGESGHLIYHRLAAGASLGDHRRLAVDAADEAIAAGCT